jgi:hypothetical protein
LAHVGKMISWVTEWFSQISQALTDRRTSLRFGRVPLDLVVPIVARLVLVIEAVIQAVEAGLQILVGPPGVSQQWREPLLQGAGARDGTGCTIQHDHGELEKIRRYNVRDDLTDLRGQVGAVETALSRFSARVPPPRGRPEFEHQATRDADM